MCEMVCAILIQEIACEPETILCKWDGPTQSNAKFTRHNFRKWRGSNYTTICPVIFMSWQTTWLSAGKVHGSQDLSPGRRLKSVITKPHVRSLDNLELLAVQVVCGLFCAGITRWKEEEFCASNLLEDVRVSGTWDWVRIRLWPGVLGVLGQESLENLS